MIIMRGTNTYNKKHNSNIRNLNNFFLYLVFSYCFIYLIKYIIDFYLYIILLLNIHLYKDFYIIYLLFY